MLLASDVYALAFSIKNDGKDQCHWCGAKCERYWTHDDAPPIPFVRSFSTAKRPSSPYICTGCFLWRRKRTTVCFLDGDYKDGQCAENYSWLVMPVPNGAQAIISNGDKARLYEILLHPPKQFVLAITTGPSKNLLQLSIANDKREIRADTILEFTVNNIPNSYTVYDLEDALTNEESSPSPGVRVLLNFLGPHASSPSNKRERGRPTIEERKHPRKTVAPISGLVYTHSK